MYLVFFIFVYLSSQQNSAVHIRTSCLRIVSTRGTVAFVFADLSRGGVFSPLAGFASGM